MMYHSKTNTSTLRLHYLQYAQPDVMKQFITILTDPCPIPTGPLTVRSQVAENRQIYMLVPTRLPQHKDPQRKVVYDPPCSPVPPLLRGEVFLWL